MNMQALRTPTIPIETLGERLRRARAAAGISVQGMADRLEVSRQMISKWENDREVPRRGMILAYAFCCSVPVNWLISGSLAVDDDYPPQHTHVEGDELGVSKAGASVRSRWLGTRVA